MTIATIQTKQRLARVLLVEDNLGDVLLTRRAFQKANIPSEITVAETADTAIALLCQQPPHEHQPMPDLVLLDLNLPGRSGQEVLKEIKSNPSLCHIPVVILSSSRAQHDVVRSYQMHANGYVVKPSSIEKFDEVIHYLQQFWFTLVVMPDVEDLERVAS